MSDACVAQLVREVDRQSKNLGSNPSSVESVFFSTERFSNSFNNFNNYNIRSETKFPLFVNSWLQQ